MNSAGVEDERRKNLLTLLLMIFIGENTALGILVVDKRPNGGATYAGEVSTTTPTLREKPHSSGSLSLSLSLLPALVPLLLSLFELINSIVRYEPSSSVIFIFRIYRS
ncbi:hypothetical protein F5Y12DRAFT_568788 [Xylaria sp. FL1777]|nr:hypothetical protein F5Y12DRAFT_568788 [Xylaria sp. FL1777]